MAEETNTVINIKQATITATDMYVFKSNRPSTCMHTMLFLLRLCKNEKIYVYLWTLWFKTEKNVEGKINFGFSLEIQAKLKLKWIITRNFLSEKNYYASSCPWSRQGKGRFAQCIISYYERDRRQFLPTWNVWKNFETTVRVITNHILTKEFTQWCKYSLQQITYPIIWNRSVHG